MAEATAEKSEKWIKWVALTTTLFAVAAAICSIKSGGFSNQITIMTTQEANQWSYFQSKSIKQHVSEMQLDTFQLKAAGPLTAGERKIVKEKIAAYQADVARYDKEKNEIKTGAEKISKDRDGLKMHSGRLGLAIMFLQLAIMMNSMASLLKQYPLFQTGSALGLIGVVMLVYGLI